MCSAGVVVVQKTFVLLEVGARESVSRIVRNNGHVGLTSLSCGDRSADRPDRSATARRAFVHAVDHVLFSRLFVVSVLRWL